MVDGSLSISMVYDVDSLHTGAGAVVVPVI